VLRRRRFGRFEFDEREPKEEALLDR
jgi:hypothetical protein